MTFNEENTIENALRDHLSQRRTDAESRMKDESGRMNLKKAAFQWLENLIRVDSCTFVVKIS